MFENFTDISPQSKKLAYQYSVRGWPNTVLFSGDLTSAKSNFIINIISNEIEKNSTDKNPDKNIIRKMIHENEHPDFYFFKDDTIKIGDPKKPQQGTIRHLLNHILPYSPRRSKKRYVYFQNAGLINDEAESALLKSLEEPPKHTYFFLSASDKDFLKETIVSRSAVLPIETIIDPQKVQSDAWEKFWYLSGLKDDINYQLLKESKFAEIIRDKYDNLSFSAADFLIFEDLGWIELRKRFKKESINTQTFLLSAAFLPILYSIRDNLTENSVPAVSPIALPFKSKAKNIAIAKKINQFFNRLTIRYFGTRPPNLNIIFFSFLNDLIKLWTAPEPN
ncbi:MAG: hypothetical protein OEZ22_03660 [Spirochaetia bacterium]|nr:hypothetical protein [Spirochaetia bacterium]